MQFIMNFLRSPFQFRSADQSGRKVESSSPVENMFIDPTTGLSADPKWRSGSPGTGPSGSIGGSPRLQHRVPGFETSVNNSVEAKQEPSVTQGTSSEDSEKSQRVRVVPIKIEGADDCGSPRKRPGSFHGSSGNIPRSSQCGPVHLNFEDVHSKKRHSSGPSVARKNDVNGSKPKVCNIPIFVEGRDTQVSPKTPPSGPNLAQNDPVSSVQSPKTWSVPVKHNGGNLVKCASKSTEKEQEKQNPCDVSLKQISDVLSELQSLKKAVSEFKGSVQDKQYRYLDEMLTRCMLKLDDVETHGNDKVRGSRKAAVKAVQECINDLESRVQASVKLGEMTAGGTGEKCDTSDGGSTQKEETSVPIATEVSGKVEDLENSSTVNEQVFSEEMEGGVSTSKTENAGIAVSEGKNFSDIPMDVEEGTTVSDSLEEVSENVQEQNKSVNDQHEQACLEGVAITASDVQCAKMTAKNDENQSCKEVKSTEDSTMEVEELRTVAEQPEKALSGPDSMDNAEVSSVPSSSDLANLPKQSEPMESDEVPDKTSVISEMEKVSKETTGAEPDKDSDSVLHVTND